MRTFYQDNLITLYHGDCLDVMPDLAAQSFDAIITDVPYGTTACAWDSPIPFAPMWACLKRLARPRSAIVLFGSQPFTSALVMSNPGWFKYDWVWQKPQGVDPFQAKYRPMNDVENISVFCDSATRYNPQFSKGDAYSVTRDKKVRKVEVNQAIMRQSTTVNEGIRQPTRVLEFQQERGIHPTQKPLALMEYLVKTYTNPGDTVLDFTSGSGTTLRACKNLGRACVGIEQDAGYCAATVKRLAPAFEEALVDDGATLEDLPMFALSQP